MDAFEFESGDWIIYIDSDLIEWGPWRVVSGSTTLLVVQVENSFQMPLYKARVRKYQMNI